jgi:hypothetical protein
MNKDVYQRKNFEYKIGDTEPLAKMIERNNPTQLNGFALEVELRSFIERLFDVHHKEILQDRN